MPQRIIAVIPARFASSRLPGKPLALIGGKPMIQHVYERVCQVPQLDYVCVATDDERIADAVRAFGGVVVLTSAHHRCGTERVAEVAQKHEAELVLNVQGDMPFVQPRAIQAIAERLQQDPELPMATAKVPITQRQIWESPHVVKVVTDERGLALYFSRSPIPYWRDGQRAGVWGYKHLGIYGFRREFLLRFAGFPPTPLEEAEALEQLRALERGFKIGVVETTDGVGIEVDTLEDLRQAEQALASSLERAPAAVASRVEKR
ncbi:MAG: 3-deoxy-manno-octulosonate cytidylyltransferase [Candidatus Binatia bacterium]|nr:3-deoxy-manno-octulosonate cytidylyltransferase [Candidatus Binatia bacterium]